MKKLRPMPADFAQVAPGKSQRVLRKHYHCGARNLTCWLSELGADALPKPQIGASLRGLPDGFAEDAHRPNVFLIAKYSCSSDTIKRWRAEVGVTPRNPSIAVPLPDGFKLVAPEMTMKQLRAHYGRSEWCIRRWCRETGVSPRRSPATFKPAAIMSKSGRRVSSLASFAPANSRAALAASYLRKFGPVTRCTAEGRYDPEGDHWRRGSTILSGEDVIERAQRNGWQPDAWKLVA